MIPLGQRAGAWCQRYLADVRPKFAVEPDDGTLFLTWDGARFSVQTMTDHVRGYVNRSGIANRELPPVPSHDGDADARRRRGHPLHPADARTHRHLIHPGLHPSLAQSAAGGPRRHAPRRVKPATQHPPRRAAAPRQRPRARRGGRRPLAAEALQARSTPKPKTSSRPPRPRRQERRLSPAEGPHPLAAAVQAPAAPQPADAYRCWIPLVGPRLRTQQLLCHCWPVHLRMKSQGHPERFLTLAAARASQRGVVSRSSRGHSGRDRRLERLPGGHGDFSAPGGLSI